MCYIAQASGPSCLALPLILTHYNQEEHQALNWLYIAALAPVVPALLCPVVELKAVEEGCLQASPTTCLWCRHYPLQLLPGGALPSAYFPISEAARCQPVFLSWLSLGICLYGQHRHVICLQPAAPSLQLTRTQDPIPDCSHH